MGPDGKGLFYRQPGRTRQRSQVSMYVVLIQSEPELTVGTPKQLFSGLNPDGSRRFSNDWDFGRSYDISPDGSRFLMLEMAPDPPMNKLHVVLNWFEELRRNVPTVD